MSTGKKDDREAELEAAKNPRFPPRKVGVDTHPLVIAGAGDSGLSEMERNERNHVPRDTSDVGRYLVTPRLHLRKGEREWPTRRALGDRALTDIVLTGLANGDSRHARRGIRRAEISCSMPATAGNQSGFVRRSPLRDCNREHKKRLSHTR